MKTHALPHCWQYLIREKNLAKDLEESGLIHEKMSTLRVCDFNFRFIPKEDKKMCHQIRDFITRHEWLGKMPQRPTHRFIAEYKGKLAGAIVMAVPNNFSLIFGKENRNLEKLISRGACISWSPKNLASSLIMYSIRWMAKNTPYRFFTAYSDPHAGELGTIYQACNFVYLGQNFGDRYKYFDPNNPQKGWFSERIFRKSGNFKNHAKRLGIPWKKQWSYRDKIFWELVPPSVRLRLKKAVWSEKKGRRQIPVKRKHKYLYILGKDKKETNQLRQLFKNLNPKLRSPYPKERMPLHLQGPSPHILYSINPRP